MKIAGVYSITCVINNKVYVGSSTNLRHRWMNHKTALKHNKHHSKLMQSDYDLYGWEAFEFKVLKRTNTRLLAWEQYWLDKLECCVKGYNTAPSSSSTLGLKPSDENKAKVSAANTGNTYNLGRTPSAETRAKISETLKGQVVSVETRHKLSISTKAYWSAKRNV